MSPPPADLERLGDRTFPQAPKSSDTPKSLANRLTSAISPTSVEETGASAWELPHPAGLFSFLHSPRPLGRDVGLNLPIRRHGEVRTVCPMGIVKVLISAMPCLR